MNDQRFNVLRNDEVPEPSGRSLNTNISVKDIAITNQKLSPMSSFNQKQKHSYTRANGSMRPPTSSNTDSPRKLERPQSAFVWSNKQKSSSEYKQMDVKHQTMLTNLASSYYEKFNLKPLLPVSLDHTNKIKYQRHPRNEEDLLAANVINPAIKKLTINESAIDNREKKENVGQNESGTFCAVKKESCYSCNASVNSTTESDITTADVQSHIDDGESSQLNNFATSEESDTQSSSYYDVKDAVPKTKKVDCRVLKKTTKYFSIQTIRNASVQTVDKSTSSVSFRGGSFETSRSCQSSDLPPKTIDNSTNPSDSYLIKKSKHKQIGQKSSIPVKCPNSLSGTVPRHVKQQSGTGVLQKIKFIIAEVKELHEEMSNFPGISADDRDYVYMDEVLMRNLIKLDNLEINNGEERAKRKEAIQFVQSSMNQLQEKLNENLAKQDDDLSFFEKDDSLSDLRTKRKIHSAIKISEK